MRTGRLAKSSQQVVLMEGRQLGPLCHLAALRPPPKSTARGAADDPARQMFLQVTLKLSTIMQQIPGRPGRAHMVLSRTSEIRQALHDSRDCGHTLLQENC